jgi:hypothetical protein
MTLLTLSASIGGSKKSLSQLVKNSQSSFNPNDAFDLIGVYRRPSAVSKISLNW